jgi:hypothetical protein
MFTVIHLPSLTGKKMLKFSSSGGALGKFALGLTLAAVLAACGGGGGGAPAATVVASTDSSSAISAADPATSAKIVTAVLDKTFTFPPVPDFGTTAATTLVLSGTGAAPTFTIASGGDTATGTMGFGSCIFTVTQSDFVAPHQLAVGQPPIVVDPCTLDAQTGGDTIGVTTDTPVIFVLGTIESEEILLPVSVAADGTVTVAGQVVGTVPTETTTATGATGAGS